jgi:hypothetical protein
MSKRSLSRSSSSTPSEASSSRAGSSHIHSPERHPAKFTRTASPEALPGASSKRVMECSLPPHSSNPMSFASYAEYDSHYAREHAHRCVECRANFPSEWMLGVHLSERHDAFVAARRDAGEKTVSAKSLSLSSCRTLHALHLLFRVV